LTTAKKIGLAAFIISEIILSILLIIGCIQVLRDKAKFEDLTSIAIAQAGVLTVTWGSQAGVNMIKNNNKSGGNFNETNT
jgi:hypothetical protein